MPERILVIQNQEIRDQADVERLLEEIKTPRSEDEIRSILGSDPVSIDQVQRIGIPIVAVLKMVIGGREVVVNDRIMQASDIEVDFSPEDVVDKTARYFTVEGTDLIIQGTTERNHFSTPEEDEIIESILKEAIVSRLSEIQG